MDEKDQARYLADELEIMFESAPFKLFWKWVENKRGVEELKCLMTGKTEGTKAEEIALSLRYRQGVLDGVTEVMELKRDLLEQLRAGRVPKVPRVVKDVE